MALIYVAGAPGAGKSELARELSARGHEAHDTDDPERTGMSGWHDKASGKYVAGFNEVPLTPDFMEGHRWQLTEAALRDFKERSRDKWIFLCGSLREPESVLAISTHVAFLMVNEETIRQRLAERALKPGVVDWGVSPGRSK